jgi:hypothetical protein
MESIRIIYFSDILCIWAYIAQIRLDELKTRSALNTTSRPFLVRLARSWRSAGAIKADYQDIASMYRRLRKSSVISAFILIFGLMLPPLPLYPVIYFYTRFISSKQRG